MILATDIKYDVNEEDIETNIELIRNKLGKKISVKKAYEYFQNHPTEIYRVFDIPYSLEIPKKIAKDDDEISDYITEKTEWLHNGYNIISIKSFSTLKKAQRACLAAQRVLMDNGIDADETATVLEALGAVMFDEDWNDIIEWNENKIPYEESIWE